MNCIYKHRVNSVIALDGAPVQPADSKFHPYYKRFQSVAQLMLTLNDIQKKRGLPKIVAEHMVRDELKDDARTASLIIN